MSPGCAKGVAGSRTTAAALWKGDGVEGPEGAVVREESKAESLFDADRAGQTALLLVQMAMSLAVCKCWPYASVGRMQCGGRGQKPGTTVTSKHLWRSWLHRVDAASLGRATRGATPARNRKTKQANRRG